MTRTTRDLVAAVLVLTYTGSANQESHCKNLDGAICERPIASLLQKDFRYEQRNKLAQEQEPVEVEETVSCEHTTGGIAGQNRCWYLSEMGESCLATCSRYGRGFMWALADSEAPLTPKLVGHIPSAKQEPWVAFECYAPSEDRYHTANANSAKHIDDSTTIGTWSHADCKLACPCGVPVKVDIKDGKEITPGVIGVVDATRSPPAQPAPNQPALAPSGVTEDLQRCSWERKPECPQLFEYKGIEYSGCATVDNPTPWCSLDRKHKGEWVTCERVCTELAPAPSTTVTTTAAIVESPCHRLASEIANDSIGYSATLDEAGYKLTVAHENPLNMKRFVCRVVAKIGCRVSSLASLMAFVPYELASKTSYQHLQSELTVLCHARDAWVVPDPVP